MVKKKENQFGKISENLKKISAVISAIGVIIGAFVGVGGWIVNQVNAESNEQIQALEARLDEAHKESQLGITRLELQGLINDTPENRTEIEKLARYYFLELDGDTYMTSMYSKWATEYGGNIEFVLK
ncbi:hypothetical protein IJF85_01035 [Candidatus Saccharibacteria bacterium]|nr:hypothetical protein [Candidatus Saccharibacteria bacterium]